MSCCALLFGSMSDEIEGGLRTGLRSEERVFDAPNQAYRSTQSVLSMNVCVSLRKEDT